MPRYRRRRFGRRRRGPAYGWGKRRAYRTTRWMSKPEIKAVDVDYANPTLLSVFTSGAGVANGTYSSLLNGLAQNDDQYHRIGRIARFIRITGHIALTHYGQTAASNTTPSAVHVRLAILQDRQCNGVDMSTLIPYADKTATGTDHIDSTAGRNLIWRKRFRTIWTRHYVTGIAHEGATSAADRQNRRMFKVNKRLHIETVYGGTSAAITDIQTNSLWFIAQWNIVGSVALTSQGINMLGSFRLRFTDV